jgi:next-to-BRCA1 protein 1
VEETPASEHRSSPSPPPAPTTEPEPTYFPSVHELQREFEDLLIKHPHFGRSRGTCPVVSSPSYQGAREVPSVCLPQEASMAEASSSTEIPVTRGAAAREKWFAELAGVSHERQNAIRNKTGVPSPPTHSYFSVYCNNCKHTIPDEHYHCSTCDDGDFDLCQACLDGGVLCNGENHWLIKRFVRNGKVTNSTTETIAPKPAAAESKTTLVPTEEEEEEEEEQDEVATRTCNSCIQGRHPMYPADSTELIGCRMGRRELRHLHYLRGLRPLHPLSRLPEARPRSKARLRSGNRGREA